MKLENCKDKSCKNKALAMSDYCWRHIQDKSVYIMSLEEHSKAGRSMGGFYLKGANLSKAFLAKADFSEADLSEVDFTGANLSECDFVGADCINTNFMLADLSKARFWHTDMTGADFTEANLQKADFLNAVLYKTNFYHSDLKEARFLTRENFKGKDNKEGIDEKGHKTARESYANLKQYFISHGRYNDVSWASYNENRMELARLWKERRIGLFPFFIMGILCGWGERPLRAIISAISIIGIYALIFFVFKGINPTLSAHYVPSFFDYLYYSTITFTTVGYGDFLPKPNVAYKLLAGSEAFIGIFMMGLFVFSLGRRYSSR